LSESIDEEVLEVKITVKLRNGEVYYLKIRNEEVVSFLSLI